jgi:hypothetical protein
MIIFIVVTLTILFILGSISPLLITDDVQDANVVERQPCSCDCSQ